MRRAVVLFSGGLDSSVLLHLVRFEEDFEPIALSVNYGQKHAIEIGYAEDHAASLGIPLFSVNLGPALAPVFQSAYSSQVGLSVDVPHGHYAAESMKTTIVPNRNMLLLAVAGAFAESIRQADESEIVVAYAAHSGDHAIYPDCRPDFVESCAETLFRATDGRVRLYAPFIRISKTDIVQRGALLRVPFEKTWSCYDPQDSMISDSKTASYVHCGLCGTCVERQEAFRDARVEDPTVYAA